MTPRFDEWPPSRPRPRTQIQTYWKMEGDGHHAEALLFTNPLGFEIEIQADGQMQRTQVHRTREQADEDARSTRARLEARGWAFVTDSSR